MASVDPTEIHPEYDTLTPENWDDWTEEQRSRYLEAKDEELEGESLRNRADMAADERAALDMLKSATGDRDTPTATVSLGDAEVEVATKLTGALEERIDRILEDRGSHSEYKEALIDAITMLIVDDNEPDGERYDFTSRAVWERYYYDEGTEGLFDIFDIVVDPALSRRERLGNSRGRTQE